MYRNIDFKLYYKTIAIETALYWHINRHEDHLNRIEGPDMNSRSYAHFVFEKAPKLYNGEKSLFNNVAGKSGYPFAKN
jgi:hypothetical protein